MSSSRQVRFARSLQPWTAVAVLSALAPASAHARPPTATDFAIYYYATDEEGDRGRQMTLQDLQQFVNQARCECNQRIEVKVTLRTSMEAFDLNRIRTFVGSNCAAGQVGNTTQYRPCALLDDQLPNFYTKSPSFDFATIWLASGIGGGSEQAIATASPRDDCSSGLGEGGLWVCVEDGMTTDCQQSEFIISGTQNLNVPMGQTTQGITYDFDPPLTVPTGFAASEGDGAIQISWDQQTTTDINGFRVLCADADGQPLPGRGVGRPDVTAENQGTLYFTSDNLCPDGPFFDTPSFDDSRPPTTDDGGPVGDTGDGDGDDGTDGGATGKGDDGATGDGTVGAHALQLWYGGAHGGGTADDGADTGATGGSEDDTAGSGRETGTGTSTGSGTDTGSGSESDDGAADGSVIDSPIASLDWSYVCSGHLPGNTRQARVDGLENGVEYQFLVVAYDVAGNPVIASELIRATPRETSGLWEQCEAQGDVCGPGGFCTCTTDDRDDLPGWLGLLALPLLLRRRRR